MSELSNFDVIDADGAIRDAAEAAGLDRGDFIKKGVLAGGGLLAGGALFGPLLASAEAKISSKKSVKNDVKILNYALTLEFLESAFYDLALANKVAGTNAPLQRFNEIVAEHEAEHVKLLKKALGSKAIKKPKFDFGDAVTNVAKFQATSETLEETGVTAYLGQATHIKQGAVLKTAGRIVTVEARHAAWIRFINNMPTVGTPEKSTPAPKVLDTPKSEAAVLAKAKPFIVT
jgi:rubrerythrin